MGKRGIGTSIECELIIPPRFHSSQSMCMRECPLWSDDQCTNPYSDLREALLECRSLPYRGNAKYESRGSKSAPAKMGMSPRTNFLHRDGTSYPVMID